MEVWEGICGKVHITFPYMVAQDVFAFVFPKVAPWQALPLACRHTWLLTGLYLSPGLFMIISSCLRLKLDTPIDFAKPASLHASRAYKESKDKRSLTCWLDFLERAF